MLPQIIVQCENNGDPTTLEIVQSELGIIYCRILEGRRGQNKFERVSHCAHILAMCVIHYKADLSLDLPTY